MRTINTIDFCHKEYFSRNIDIDLCSKVNQAKEKYKKFIFDKEPFENIPLTEEYRDNLINCYTNKLRSDQEIFRYISENANYRCVYCSLNETYTLDHFFPKTTYPILAIISYNLLPACGYCNGKKSDTVLDITHPYSKEEYQYAINVKLEMNNGRITIEYFFESNDNNLLIFVEKLELKKRYQNRMLSEFNDLTTSWSKMKKKGLKSCINKFVLSKRKYLWERKFYEALQNNIDLVYEYCSHRD